MATAKSVWCFLNLSEPINNFYFSGEAKGTKGISKLVSRKQTVKVWFLKNCILYGLIHDKIVIINHKLYIFLKIKLCAWLKVDKINKQFQIHILYVSVPNLSGCLFLAYRHSFCPSCFVHKIKLYIFLVWILLHCHIGGLL